MSPAQLEERVLASLDRADCAFNEGKAEFFDEFAEDALIFTPDSKEPIKGRGAYVETYGSTLTSERRQKKVIERNLQIVGDRAVVTQKAQIAQGETNVDVLQTIVYGLTSEGVKVMHHQTARLAPRAAAGLSFPSVNVVNEQIATVAAVVGVAQ